MKKSLIPFLIIFFGLNLCAFAANNLQSLGKIENSLFGFEYVNDNETQRVARIEKEIYGAENTGDLNKRIAKINKDFGTEFIGQEITPCEDTFALDEYEAETISSQDPNIDYPVINELEQSVFNEQYKNLGVKDRLAQLENKVFAKNYPSDDLSTRVDRLRDKIRPQALEQPSIANNNEFHTDGYYPDFPDYDGLTIGGNGYNTFYNDMYSQPSYSAPRSGRKVNLSTVENSLYHNNYKNDTTQNRLARVEQSMFGQSFDNEDESTRMERISGAFRAQKSASKYDSNKFAQNMATAMQIGTMLLMILACIL